MSRYIDLLQSMNQSEISTFMQQMEDMDLSYCGSNTWVYALVKAFKTKKRHTWDWLYDRANDTVLELFNNDEENRSNINYMINLLMDIQEEEGEHFQRFHIDDGGSSAEAMVYYNVNCPYVSGDERAGCYKTDDVTNREMCSECKYKWLLSEVDC